MYLGRKLNAKTKEALISPPFVYRLAQYINNTIAPMKVRYGITNLKISLSPHSTGVYTDGKNIVVGLDSEVIKLYKKLPTLNVPNTAVGILGLIFHELGHVLYTPFSALRMAFTAFERKRFWPEKPISPKTDVVIDYLKDGPDNLKKMFSIYKTLANILEDGRIEAILLLKNANHGLYAQGLRLWRKIHYKHVLPNVSDKLDELDAMSDGKEKDLFRFDLYFDILLTIAKYGRYKSLKPKHYSHPLIKDIDNIVENIEDAVDSINAKVFYNNLNIIFVESFEGYIKPYLDNLPDKSEVENALKEICKTLGEGIDKMSKATAEEIEKATAKAKEELEKTHPSKEASEKDSSDRESSSSSSSDKGDGEEESSETSTPGDTDTDGDESTSSPTSIPRVKTSSIWEGETGCFDTEDDTSEELYPLDLEAVGKTPVSFSSEEDEIADSLETSKDLDYGSMNANLKIKLVRIKDPGVSTLYKTYEKYVKAGKTAAKKIHQFLKKEERVFYEKNHYSGTRFAASRIANPNLKHFDKKITIPKSPTLSVAILVDQSGSMGGRNIEIARATAIALFEMCSALEVSFAVFGHCADRDDYDVIIDNYCYFGEAQDKDKYRLLKIHAGGNNRDGAALRYVSEVLAKQKTEKKLLFIISDGQPAAIGYYGTEAEKDIQAVIKDYERLGVRYIAAAIDADKEQIKAIYDPKRFLNIDDVETLPTKLMAIIRKSLVR